MIGLFNAKSCLKNISISNISFANEYFVGNIVFK